MKSHAWADQLPYYAAGTLPADARAALEDHLAECAQCRADLREWQRIAAAARSRAASRVAALPPLRRITRNTHQESRLMFDTMISYPPQIRPRQLPLTLAAAVLLVILLGGVILAAALRSADPGTPGAPALLQNSATATPIPSLTFTPTATPLLTNPIQVVTATPAALPDVPTIVPPMVTPILNPSLQLSWFTGTAWLAAEEISIIAQGVTFSPAGQTVNVTSDPGGKTFTTLELTWIERGVEMRLNLYFHADDQSWWASEIRTYDGQVEGDWITYADSPYFMAPLGQPFTAEDVTFRNGSGDQITFKNLQLQAFLPPSTVTVVPTLSNAFAQAESDLPASVQLDGLRYEAQGWNNQGPASLSMALSYWGWAGDQTVLAEWLKPNSEDKNVSPWEMVYYVNRFTDYHAIYRLGGTTHLMQQLLAAGFPAIVETGIEPAELGWMGHYRVLYGYNDDQGVFMVHDSYLGENQMLGYEKLDEDWASFSRTFIVVYDPAREMDLRLALGAYADPVAGAGTALDAARAAVSLNREDAWAWFSLGTAYVTLGEYENAVTAYNEAIQLGLPFRALWCQFGPYEAYFHTGRYTALLALTDNMSATTEYVEETYYWQGMVYAAQGEAESAAASLAEVIRLNPNFLTTQSEYFHLETAAFDLPPQLIPLDTVAPHAPAGAIEYPTVPPPSLVPTVVPPTVVPPVSPTFTPTATPVP